MCLCFFAILCDFSVVVFLSCFLLVLWVIDCVSVCVSGMEWKEKEGKGRERNLKKIGKEEIRGEENKGKEKRGD